MSSHELKQCSSLVQLLRYSNGLKPFRARRSVSEIQHWLLRWRDHNWLNFLFALSRNTCKCGRRTKQLCVRIVCHHMGATEYGGIVCIPKKSDFCDFTDLLFDLFRCQLGISPNFSFRASFAFWDLAAVVFGAMYAALNAALLTKKMRRNQLDVSV